MANIFRIVTLGDSVSWGQGLLENEKYDVLVADALKQKIADVVLEPRLAHSGAVIGVNGAAGSMAPGEVPEARLTIVEQCDSFTNSPETVDLVLLNGGINDVRVDVILDPLAIVPSLSKRIEVACHEGMLALLRKVSAKFTKPSCKILVTGYYTILSEESDPLAALRLLRMHNISLPERVEEDLGFLNPILRRCEEFFDESTSQLTAAVADAHDGRIQFVPSGFTDDNAAFVPGTSLLWGLNLDLSPQDPVANLRRPQCDTAFPGPLQLFEREKCHRASAGHPNVTGAIQFKNQILAALMK